MAYIDIDKFAESICNFQAIDEDAANAMIWLLRTFPIADVVPKSEVAREIFEEIEKLLKKNELRNYEPCNVESYYSSDLEKDLAKLKKKYTESEKDNV